MPYWTNGEREEEKSYLLRSDWYSIDRVWLEVRKNLYSKPIEKSKRNKRELFTSHRI